MWLMLQQEKQNDHVIGLGKMATVEQMSACVGKAERQTYCKNRTTFHY